MPLFGDPPSYQLAAAAAKRIAEGEPDYRRRLSGSKSPSHRQMPQTGRVSREIDKAVAGHQALFALPSTA